MINVRVSVRPHQARGPGWAEVVIIGVPTTLSPTLENSRFSLQRNQDGRYLAEQDEWNAAEVWHTPNEIIKTNANQSSNETVFLMGPGLLDELLSDPRVVCRLHLQVAQQSLGGVLRLSAGLYPSGAAGNAPAASRQVTAQAPALTPPPSPPPSPPPTLEPVVAPRRRLPLLLFLLILAMIGIAAAWWLLDKQERQTPVAATATTSVESDSLPPCSAERLSAQTDDLAFLQACVASTPSTEQVLAIVAAGKTTKRCDLIQRLYAQQAQAGNSDIGLAYAREFDPDTFTGGCFEQPDAETAIYWYQTVLTQQPDNSDVKARVESLENSK